MPRIVACPSCGQQLAIPDTVLAGALVRCPCGATMTAPGYPQTKTASSKGLIIGLAVGIPVFLILVGVLIFALSVRRSHRPAAVRRAVERSIAEVKQLPATRPTPPPEPAPPWVGEPAVSGDRGRDWVRSRRKASPKYKGPKVLLQVKFTPGAYTLTESEKSTKHITVQGQEQVVRESMTITGDVEISPPDPSGEQRVRYICRTIKQRTSAPGQTMSFDSEGPPDEQNAQLAAAFRPLVGWEGTVIGRNGKFTKVEGVEDLMMRISASLPQGASQMIPKMRKMMQAFMKELLTKHWGAIISKQPVGPGDEWTASIHVQSIPFLGEATFDCYCLLEDIENTPRGKSAILDFAYRSTISDRPVDTSMFGSLPVKATIKRMEFDGTGTAHFDMDIGLSTDVTIDLKGKGDMSMRAPGDQSMDMHIDFDVSGKNSLRKVR